MNFTYNQNGKEGARKAGRKDRKSLESKKMLLPMTKGKNSFHCLCIGQLEGGDLWSNQPIIELLIPSATVFIA